MMWSRDHIVIHIMLESVREICGSQLCLVVPRGADRNGRLVGKSLNFKTRLSQ